MIHTKARKIFACILCIGMVFSVASATAFASVPESYGIYVQDIQVTAANASDILGSRDYGATVTYNADTNTLRLEGADLSSCDTEQYLWSAAIRAEQDLTIELLGGNYISGTGSAIRAKNSHLLITGDALFIENTEGAAEDISCRDDASTLTISGCYLDIQSESTSIYTYQDILIQNSTLNIAAFGTAIKSSDGSVTITGSSVSASGSLGSIIASQDVTITGSTIDAIGAANEYGLKSYGIQSVNGAIQIEAASHIKAISETQAITAAGGVTFGEGYARTNSYGDFQDAATVDHAHQLQYEYVGTSHLTFAPNMDEKTHSPSCNADCNLRITLPQTEDCSSETATCADSFLCDVCDGKFRKPHTLDGEGQCTVCGASQIAYDLYVQGVQVTGKNMNDVLGDADEGATVTYDAAGNTLNLHDAHLETVSYYDADANMQENAIMTGMNLTISLWGDNTISGSGSGILLQGHVTTITGDSLTITANTAITDYSQKGRLHISDAVLQIKDSTIGISLNARLDVSGSKLTVTNVRYPISVTNAPAAISDSSVHLESSAYDALSAAHGIVIANSAVYAAAMNPELYSEISSGLRADSGAIRIDGSSHVRTLSETGNALSAGDGVSLSAGYDRTAEDSAFAGCSAENAVDGGYYEYMGQDHPAIDIPGETARILSCAADCPLAYDNLGDAPAVDSNGDGIYEIANAAQLYWFAKEVNGGNAGLDAVLVSDITAGSWIPVGNGEIAYNGTFDGQGYTIYDLYCPDTNRSYVGLFGHTGTDAVVKNVTVKNGAFTGNSWVAGLVGKNEGEIIGCRFDGVISGAEYPVGGIAAANRGSITGSVNDGSISGKGGVGGIAGYNVGTIDTCINNGTVTGLENAVDYGYFGGIAGLSEGGSILNSTNAGDISGTMPVGGIVGHATGTTVENCTDSGSEDENGNLGGDGTPGDDPENHPGDGPDGNENGTDKDPSDGKDENTPSDAPETGSAAPSPNTGDSSAVLLWALLAAASVGVIVLAWKKMRKLKF